MDDPVDTLVKEQEDTLFFEFVRLEARYQMSDNILMDMNDPLNISNCEEDEVEEDEIDMSGTLWD